MYLDGLQQIRFMADPDQEPLILQLLYRYCRDLKIAGFELNTELTDFYKNYADARPEAGTSVQDYTLPEPTADAYK